MIGGYFKCQELLARPHNVTRVGFPALR